jgi:RNA polymerase sigma-70 factor (ECF subfamily)
MNGNELTLEETHAAFRSKIHRYLTRMVGEFEAEDLTQEVFIKIGRALKNFRGESALSTWVYRIATNAALDRLRSPSFQWIGQKCSTEDLIAEGEPEIDDRNAGTGEKTPQVESMLYRKEMNACILDFIERLPEDYRAVLVLSEFEELSNNEIAEILGITLNTVKIRLHRARERLKKELAANCDSYWIEENEFVPELGNTKK